MDLLVKNYITHDSTKKLHQSENQNKQIMPKELFIPLSLAHDAVASIYPRT